MSTHVVVDGSNLATEGRKLPNLEQLVEAVDQFRADRPHDRTTVVCDASFPNRIGDSERKRYEQLVDDGWLITPPAGAVGRGDAFILQVAAKAGAIVLSNDSFQEFHGEHPWLFEEGRLVGGKPVPGVGWVYVDRIPVRGPASRRSVRDSKSTEDIPASPSRSSSSARKARAATAPAKSKVASKPTESEEGPKRRTRKATSAAKEVALVASSPDDQPESKDSDFSNRRAAFREFIKEHPIGSMVEARIEAYSSHGAYVKVDKVWCYMPTKSLGDPSPRRLRDVLAENSVHSFVVVEFNRREFGVELASVPAEPGPKQTVPAKRKRKRTAKPKPEAVAPAESADVSPTKKQVTKKRAPRKRAAKKAVAKKQAPKKQAPKKQASKKAVTRTRTAGSPVTATPATGDDDGAATRRKRTGSRR
jgi:hypothetical protein